VIPDWIDNYLDNEGWENGNRAFGFIRNEGALVCANMITLLKEVIKSCSEKEKTLTSDNLKKLQIRIINEYCFNNIKTMESKKNSKYEYVIFMPERAIKENPALVKHKVAHELAHFLFSLQGKQFNSMGEEQKECNRKADEWGFPDLEKSKNST